LLPPSLLSALPCGQDEGIAMMEQRLLPCDHLHVVFTLPNELNPIWSYNRHWWVLVR
jgi:hypothetical protein